MKTPQMILLLLTILVHAGAAFPSDRREKVASWDDVNVVAHGLLQLGQGLKEHVDKSKAQMRDVMGRLKQLNGSLEELQSRQKQQGDALRAQSEEAQERARLLIQLAEKVKENTEDMTSRMDRLEEALTETSLDSNDSEHNSASFVQRAMMAQNRRIDQLVERIKQQQDKLEKQSLHLQALQSKVAHKRAKSQRRRDEETAVRRGAEHIQIQAGLARDCHELYERGHRVSGVYSIQPVASSPFSVLCQMTSDGGWTVLQKRHNGSQNFNQLWENYKKGFGSLSGEFWLGLDSIHSISSQGRYVLQVEVSDEVGQKQTARYAFQLDGEENMFALHLKSSSGAQAELMHPSGVPFSTPDRDNDLSEDTNCAELLSGGWWFSSCGDSNLNGRYPRRPLRRRHSMFGSVTRGWMGSLRKTLLKIAPASINV